jgi:hypothetical protein
VEGSAKETHHSIVLILTCRGHLLRSTPHTPHHLIIFSRKRAHKPPSTENENPAQTRGNMDNQHPKISRAHGVRMPANRKIGK